MKSRIYRCLATPLLVSIVLEAGCATSDAASHKHKHSPWRYRHMNHTHTRPWDKDMKPPKSCEACAKVPDTGAKG